MPDICIKVRDKIATSSCRIVQDNTNYTVVFDFDDEWAEYPTKTMRVQICGDQFIDIVFDGDTAPLPKICGSCAIAIGVYAGDLHATTPALIRCTGSILTAGGAPVEPPEDVYAQLMEKLNHLDGGVSLEVVAEVVASYFAENPLAIITNHADLEGREVADSHPIEAIKGLAAALSDKQPAGDYAERAELSGLASEQYVQGYAQPVGKYLTAETDPTVPDWAKQPTPPAYTAGAVGADPAGAAAGAVSEHNVSTDSHQDIRLLVEELTKRFNALADSDDIDLDQLSEIITYIQDNRGLIDTVTTSKVNYTDIVDNLSTNVAGRPLSAAQGVELKRLIDAITVPTKLSELADDAAHRTVTDAEKTAWGKKSEFSGLYADLPDKPTIPEVPSTVSAFHNDAGYLAVAKNTFANGATVALPSGNSEWVASEEISALTITFPTDEFEAWVKFTTAASGEPSIAIPPGGCIGTVPTFGNGETWELSIKNGVLVAGKVEVGV